MSPPRTKNTGAMSVLGVLRMLEKHILKYKPRGEMGKELEWILEVTRTLAGKELAGQTATMNMVRVSHKQIKADLCSLYKALDSRLTEIQGSQEKLLTSTEALSKTTDNLHTTARELETKVVKVTDTTDKIANTAMSYRDPLLTKVDSPNRASIDPKVLSDIERRSKQILIDCSMAEIRDAADTSLAKLREKANTNITGMDDYCCPEGTAVEKVTKTRDGSLLLMLNSREAADWLREPKNKYIFLEKFTTGAIIRDWHHNILMHWTLTSFNPFSKAHHKEIEELNDIKELSIRSTQWIKPPRRRRPGQTKAHMVFSFSSANVANYIIHDGIDIGGL